MVLSSAAASPPSAIPVPTVPDATLSIEWQASALGPSKPPSGCLVIVRSYLQAACVLAEVLTWQWQPDVPPQLRLYDLCLVRHYALASDNAHDPVEISALDIMAFLLSLFLEGQQLREPFKLVSVGVLKSRLP